MKFIKICRNRENLHEIIIKIGIFLKNVNREGRKKREPCGPPRRAGERARGKFPPRAFAAAEPAAERRSDAGCTRGRGRQPVVDSSGMQLITTIANLEMMSFSNTEVQRMVHKIS